MRKFLALFTLGILLGACSNADSTVNSDNINDSENVTFEKKGSGFDGEIVSPQGYVVTSNIDDLKKILFDSDYDAYEITDIDFIESGTSEGTAAYVTYEFESLINTIAFAVGNITIGYENSGDVITKRKTVSLNTTIDEVDYITYKCNGAGCCRVGGTFNPSTGQGAFFCKCENNPEGNSDCSLAITVVTTEHTLDPSK